MVFILRLRRLFVIGAFKNGVFDLVFLIFRNSKNGDFSVREDIFRGFRAVLELS